MSNNLSSILNTNQYDEHFQEILNFSIIEKVRFYRSQNLLCLNLNMPEIIGKKEYLKLVEEISTNFKVEVDLTFNTASISTNIRQVSEYLWLIKEKLNIDVLNQATACVNENQITLLFSDQVDYQNAIEEETNIIHAFNNLGFNNFAIEISFKEIKINMQNIKIEQKPQDTCSTASENVKPKQNYRKKKEYTLMKIKDIKDTYPDICFEGKVFKQEIRQVGKKQINMQILSVTDYEDAINIKRFESRLCSIEQMKMIKEGMYVKVSGSIIFDNFEKALICNPTQIDIIPHEEIQDMAEKKRVELHVHTKMSEMDGVNNAIDYIKQAIDWGHLGIAITDHMVAQSFPKAQRFVEGYNKNNPDNPFKVLYGVEMNLVDEHLKIVRNATNDNLNDLEYVCFDLETTGLSNYYDHIIEFGGVIIKNNTVIDRLQLFVKPPIVIPPFIQEKTNITMKDVENAQPFSECVDQILSWIGNRPIVAHNATFDYGFLNEELRRINRQELTNPVIDTLDLARALHSDRRSYRLGNIARLYRIAYDEDVAHRADYDADVLADIFLAMLKDCKQKGAATIADLEKLEPENAYVKIRKSHLMVMAKNQAGIKDLYNLVTISNTETLAVFGNSNSKNNGSEYIAEPRIFKRHIEKFRNNVLLGTSCCNSDVFEIAMNRNDEELDQALMFYDYVEIQPLDNYSHLIYRHAIHDLERLKQIILRIIEHAKKLDKIIVASGDVHYLHREDKIFRDIYIQTQGIGGVRHPLYIYNAQLRKNSVNPNQHFRTTSEMLKEFEWLNDPQLIEDLVINNPLKIFNSIENCQPVPNGLFPPSISGSDEKLTEICYQTAHNIYGDDLPEIVEARLKRELDSIIGNGYAVIYYISHLLVKKSNEDGYLVGSRGSVGSSFVATMSGITEVNPLKPHYICKNCHHYEFIEDDSVSSGFDLVDKPCPHCQQMMKGEGQNIPFETFLGFEGDKVPDIDLNFSGAYQPQAHNFTKTVFGETHALRAGTIGTVAEKTAFGYVSGYCEMMGIENMSRPQKEYLAMNCQGVKRTTGQHPGGIIVIPSDMDATDFTPVQFPANDPKSEWKTTHFDFHDIHDNVLKFDILGHVDPTVMRLLQNISGIDPLTIPMNDLQTMSLFSSADALKADVKQYPEVTGALGLPEFGTKFVRGMLEDTKPKTFSDLIIISGLSHGTDVWLNNAADLVKDGIPLQEVIGCRDDIMTYLLHKDLPPKMAFTIMEFVRKGKGLKPEWEQLMKDKKVPEWYINSCKKIKYMFPKAHAVAYVIMAVRIAWFKVHYPHFYYVAYFTLRCDAYEIETMCKGLTAINQRIDEISAARAAKDYNHPVTKKEIDIQSTLEVCRELYARGYKISNVDLYKSKATEFCVLPDDLTTIIPPFTVIDGLGENVALSIVKAREEGEFISKEDLMRRSQCSSSLCAKLTDLNVLKDLQEKNQLSLF